MFSNFGDRIVAFFNQITLPDIIRRHEERSEPTSYAPVTPPEENEWHSVTPPEEDEWNSWALVEFINERNEVIRQMREEHEESGMNYSSGQCDDLKLALKKSCDLVEFYCFDQHAYAEAFEAIEQVQLFKVCTPLFILYSLNMLDFLCLDN